MVFVVKFSSSDELVVVPLCPRCREEPFSAESWTKLFGTHPATLDEGDATFDTFFTGNDRLGMLNFGAKNLPLGRGPILRLHIPTKDVMRSSRENCGFCRILVELDTKRYISKKRFETAQVDVQLFIPAKHNGTWFPIMMQVTLVLESKEGGSLKNSRFLALLDDHSKVKAQDTDEKEVLALDIEQRLLEEASQWIQECKTKHTNCALAEDPLLPMRVLDLQDPGSVDSLKLIECEAQQHGNYVALSYVWGTLPCLRLLDHNRVTLMAGILMENLPRTIQDAVKVTRALNIRYLWVDSLCILQDSVKDKELQIPRMKAYYKGAMMVISASGAADVHAGFLGFQRTEDEIIARAKARAVALFDHGPIPYRFPVHFPKSDTGIATNAQYFLIDVDPPLYDHDREPINKRGWTLQESTLARRLLIFPSTGGIIMRCSEGESFAGNLLGDPFHEEPGLLRQYSESDAQDGDSDEELREDETSEDEHDDEEWFDEDSNDDEDSEEEESGDANSRILSMNDRDARNQTEEDDEEHHSFNENANRHEPETKMTESESSDMVIKNEEQNIETQTAKLWISTEKEATKRGNNHDDAEDVTDEKKADVDGSGKGNEDDDDELEPKRKTRQEDERRDERRDEVSNSWLARVTDYSRRNLTQSSDTLIALGALAQEFHSQHTNVLGNYAAGLWTERLKEGLLWHLSYPPHPDRESYIPPRKSVSEYRAPSWSWASCGQPVTYRNQREPDLGHISGNSKTRTEPTWCIEIMACSVTPLSARNPFGAVQTAYMDVKGLLLPIRRVPRHEKDQFDRCAVEDVALLECEGLLFFRTDLFAPDSLDALERLDSSCYWLPVYDATRQRCRGLLVGKTASEQYKRLGFAEFQIPFSGLPQREETVIRLI